MNALGIYTAGELAAANPVRVQERFSVVRMRTVLDLQGVQAVQLEEERKGKDQLIFSRSVSDPLTTTKDMRQVLSVYASQAAARLVKHEQLAKVLTAWAGTSPLASAPVQCPQSLCHCRLRGRTRWSLPGPRTGSCPGSSPGRSSFAPA
ncbi:hypothetical protein P9849_01170 [Arthrobacter sp. Y-9]|nr:hypothetical protein [Arthrobacter sp. Y-9]WFR84287.1 hypothetical protein P9849_01170 [Arthrobacter sp. Y-9]